MTTEASVSLPALPTAQEAPDERKFWKKVKRTAARLPFAEKLLSTWYYATDKETSRKTKLLLYGALAYFVLPLDAIPDVVAAVGFTDDGAILLAALAAVQSMPERYQEQAVGALRALRVAKVVGDLAEG